MGRLDRGVARALLLGPATPWRALSVARMDDPHPQKVLWMSKTQFCLGLTCLSFGVVACEGEPEQLEISSTQAALTASENAELALQGVIDASDFLASSTSIAKTLNAFGAGGQTCESSGSFCPVGAECPPVETVCTSHEISEEDLE